MKHSILTFYTEFPAGGEMQIFRPVLSDILRSHFVDNQSVCFTHSLDFMLQVTFHTLLTMVPVDLEALARKVTFKGHLCVQLSDTNVLQLLGKLDFFNWNWKKVCI